MLYLWNIFLQFHRYAIRNFRFCKKSWHEINFVFVTNRSNKKSIMEFLRDGWAKDRRAEWSIWMVYSKVEMPHHFLHSGSDDSTSHHGVHKRVSNIWKLNDDVSNAVFHRRSKILSFLTLRHSGCQRGIINFFFLFCVWFIQPSQSAAIRAERHRRSIAQMKVVPLNFNHCP